MKGFLFLIAALIVLNNCSNPVKAPEPESIVVLSYKYYPVPDSFGDSIKVYVDNRFDHSFYAKDDFVFDTFRVCVNTEINAQYTLNGKEITDTYIIASDTNRILVGFGFGKKSL